MMDNATQLIDQHRDYVRALAKKIARQLPPSADLEELIAFGNVGLVEAAQRYDPVHGAAFQTFAYYRIRGAIFDGLRKMLSLPPSVYKRLRFQAGADQVANEQSYATDDDPDSQAECLANGIRDMAALYVLSVGSEHARYDAAGHDDDPAQTVEHREFVERLDEAIRALSDRKQRIIRGYYFESRTLTEIAGDFGVTRFTASRWHTEAVRELRTHLESPRPARRNDRGLGSNGTAHRATCVAGCAPFSN